MEHTCQDCDHVFSVEGQNEPHIAPAVQCPRCHSYRTQPAGIPDENNDMLHGVNMGMPDSTMDDMSGNPLQEGFMNDWKDRQVRDESFGGGTYSSGPPESQDSPDMGEIHILPSERSANGRHQVMVIDSQGNSQWPTQYGPGRYGWDFPENVKTPTHLIDQAYEYARALDRTRGTRDAPAPHPTPVPNEYGLIPFYHPGQEQSDPTHPDPWMDNEPGTTTFPQQWTHEGRIHISLFETPEFETQEVIEPPSLGAAHQTTIQVPKGITDNLHATLGNLGAWVENPHENGQLRPYSNKYWKSIRPQFMAPGSLRIGVTDPIMAEIINHVAQTDDMTPLYQYRGRTSSTRTAGPLLALGPLADVAAGAAADIGVGGAADAAATGAADAAATAGASEAASGAAGDVAATGDTAGGVGDTAVSTDPATAGGGGNNSAGGIANWMKRIPKALGQGALFNAGQGAFGVGMGLVDDVLGMGGTNQMPQMQINQGYAPGSFYSHTASDEDDASPSSHDEIPKNDDGDSKQKDDGNSHEWQRDISVNGVGGTDHVPSFDPAGPAFQRFMMLVPLLMQYMETGEDASQDPLIHGLHQALDAEIPGYLNHSNDEAGQRLLMVFKNKGGKPEKTPGEEPTHTDENSGGKKEGSRVAALRGEAAEFLPNFTVSLPYLWPKTADTQGPQTPEQIQAVQQWLIEHGGQMGLEGDELMQTILSVPTNPLEFADILAEVQQKEPPPPPPPAQPGPPTGPTGLSQGPPMPPQEAAPPGATMPMPGMGAQGMMSAVKRYAADNVASKCPKCDSHTTEILNEDGDSHCHACNHFFKTQDVTKNDIQATSASTHWNVDEDYRKVASPDHSHGIDPTQVGGHTWLDEGGSPLKVGQEYEMYSKNYDIPDLVRIEAIKPDSIVYTLTGEFGLEHSSELTKEEARLEGETFKPTDQGDQGAPDDGSLEQNNDDNTGFTGTGQRDLTQPDSVVSNYQNPALEWLMAGVEKTAGANFTPMEQRALIEESGMARNSDLLDLVGTHYIQDADDDQFTFGW